MASLADTATPPGLHIHLVPLGPSLRFVLWFERYAEPLTTRLAQQERITEGSRHPGCDVSRPAWLPGGATKRAFFVRIPHLRHGFPVPLPGLVASWDLERLNISGQKQATHCYLISGWQLPLELSVAALRSFLLEWRARFGDGFLAPQVLTVLDFLGELEDRLIDGPLLPALAVGPDIDGYTGWLGKGQPLVWVPPVPLADVNRLLRMLVASPYLGAVVGLLRQHQAPDSHLEERTSTRLARFLVDILGADAGARAEAYCADPDSALAPARLHSMLLEGEASLIELHRAHGSCLHPHHPIFLEKQLPAGHTLGRIRVVGTGSTRTQSLRLDLGHVVEKDWSSIASLDERGVLHDDAVEYEGVTSFRPAQILFRDWSLLQMQEPLFRCPELLENGSMPISEADAGKLLAHGPYFGHQYDYLDFLDRVGIPKTACRIPRRFTVFAVVPEHSSAVRLRIRWNLATNIANNAGAGATPTTTATAAAAAASAAAVTSGAAPDESAGIGLLGALGMVRFVPSLSLAFDELDIPVDEAERLVATSMTDSLLRIGDKVLERAALLDGLELAHARIKVLARLCASDGLSFNQVVDFEDGFSDDLYSARQESIFAAQWELFLQSLTNASGVPLLTAPTGFGGVLRPYQERGLSWLSFFVEHGIGGCLADDMGLGKTVQVLALLLHRQHERERERQRERSPTVPPASCLVVCPTSVVTNWAREAARFAPTLRVYVHQGPARACDEQSFVEAVGASDLVVTSWVLARCDSELLAKVDWDLAIVDEAQNMKSPKAEQTRAVKSLRARARFALTGTPIENRLRDLWSIYDFINPGLLGGHTRFARAFATPIRAGNERALARLQRRVSPFLLRRTKLAVASDLPPKQEQEVYCELTREQVALYQAMAEAAIIGLEHMQGIMRKAHILQAILHLKQICNHPENFAIDRPGELLGRSGKLDRFLELVEELLAEGQPVLVYSQFVKMGGFLCRAIEQKFDLFVPLFHGALQPDERDRIVADFQSDEGPPILVLSLRAGGTGLNLTRAKAVIHFDRWWNPAVEDQATDRAHRIGQTGMVNVFKLVTSGTIEERILEMLVEKRDLANKILGAADESWITEMSNDELRELFTLGSIDAGENHAAGKKRRFGENHGADTATASPRRQGRRRRLVAPLAGGSNSSSPAATEKPRRLPHPPGSRRGES
ncbi:MAG: DEAD/DEAH box helicase [Pseudomonadota bacterium]